MTLVEGEGFAAYAIYNAIHLHFTSKSYDYFKYNGKTNVSKDSFLHRKDKYSFHKLARKYSLTELRNFFVANFMEHEVKWVGELTGEDGESTYRNWIKRRDSLSYVFEDNLDFLFYHVKKPDDLLKVVDDYPVLLKHWMENDIYIETVCILNDMMNFLPLWIKKIDDDIIWPNYKLKIEKYSPFIEYNKVRLKTILKGKIDEYFHDL